MRRSLTWGLILCNTLLVFGIGGIAGAKEAQPLCPGAESPPPPILRVDLSQLLQALAGLRETSGRLIWHATPENERPLGEIFETSSRTKLEQFFQLLYLLQKGLSDQDLPIVVRPPGITRVLLAARVFTDTAFPEKITEVRLFKKSSTHSPGYQVEFSAPEVRFPINGGEGFSVWEQGMCQIAKELVFYPGFSFRLRTARNSKNLVVDDFQGVEIFGQFGTRRIFSIDLNYVALEKVEFIRGTDQGRVQSRVSPREFKENKHSRLFRFIGTLIPNTSRQRIDW